jgi:hypothetical protein
MSEPTRLRNWRRLLFGRQDGALTKGERTRLTIMVRTGSKRETGGKGEIAAGWVAGRWALHTSISSKSRSKFLKKGVTASNARLDRCRSCDHAALLQAWNVGVRQRPEHPPSDTNCRDLERRRVGMVLSSDRFGAPTPSCSTVSAKGSNGAGYTPRMSGL